MQRFLGQPGDEQRIAFEQTAAATGRSSVFFEDHDSTIDRQVPSGRACVPNECAEENLRLASPLRVSDVRSDPVVREFYREIGGLPVDPSD